MKVIVGDFETYWDTEHTLKKMSAVAYCTSPKTQLISLSLKIGKADPIVVFGEKAIRELCASVDWSDAWLIAHNNAAFDSMIFAWRLGVRPKLWGCTMSMARPLFAKTIGVSLAKVVEHYGRGVKDNTVLLNTRGKRLEEFTPDELQRMAKYNSEDTSQCHDIFYDMLPHFSSVELLLIDFTIRMLVEPKFELNYELLESALVDERKRKQDTVMALARHLIVQGLASDALADSVALGGVEEAMRKELASAPKFSKLLGTLGIDTPMKPSPKKPDAMIPALAKTDEAFVAMREHADPLVCAAAEARLAVKSTLLETRIQAFIATGHAAQDKFPVPLHYCGADTTGRKSGWIYNCQNLPRINHKTPKISDALRYSIIAPPGHVIMVADQSGIELRVNHFLWKVKESMALYKADRKADLYKAFAAVRYGVPVEKVSPAQRQLAKVAQLGLGFNAAAKTFKSVAKTQGGLDLSLEQSQSVVTAWRARYAEIVGGWDTCHSAIRDIHEGVERSIDPWKMCRTCAEGVVLPSRRLIRYPGLHIEYDKDGRPEWWYGYGRSRARIYGGKMVENIVQALARDTIMENAVTFFNLTGLRPQLMVHDELVYVVPEDTAPDFLSQLQQIMRTPPAWWPELVTESEGGFARSYGDAK